MQHVILKLITAFIAICGPLLMVTWLISQKQTIDWPSTIAIIAVFYTASAAFLIITHIRERVSERVSE